MDLFALMNSTKPPRVKLLEAVRENNVGELDKLLQDGINPNLLLQEQGGDKAVHMAAFYGHYHCLERLLASGANGDVSNDFGVTPLLNATRNQHWHVMELLLRSCKCLNDCRQIWLVERWKRLLNHKNEDVILTLLRATPDLNILIGSFPALKQFLLYLCFENTQCKLRLLKLLWHLSVLKEQEIKTKLSDEQVHNCCCRTCRVLNCDKSKVDSVEWCSDKSPMSLEHFCLLAVRKSFHGICNVYYGAHHLPVPTAIRDSIIFVTNK